jgi:hypothetical protein
MIWGRRFTSPPKKGLLKVFIALKIHRPQLGVNPQTLGPMASMLTTKPLMAITGAFFPLFLPMPLITGL